MSKSPRRKLKIGTIDDFHHFWYLLIWIVYLSLFYLAEHLVTKNYWVSYLPIDDQIPFCRFFIVPYCLWHPLLVLMTAYLIFTDPPAFKRFMLYIGFGFGGSIIFCMLFPENTTKTAPIRHALTNGRGVMRIAASDCAGMACR